MKKLQIASVVGVLSAMVSFANAQEQCSATGLGIQTVNPCTFATLGGVNLIASFGDDLAEGVHTTTVSAQAVSEDGRLVTFTNLAYSGGLHQVWDSVIMGPTAKGAPAESALYNAEWVPWDSHVAITMDMVGGQAGGGYTAITEGNDGSRGDGGLPPATAGTAMAGFGSINMDMATDAFFVAPDHQLRSIELANLVTTTGGEAVTMTLGILGSGITDAGTEGGAAFGYDGNPTVSVPFNAIPEPASGAMSVLACLGMLALRRRIG